MYSEHIPVDSHFFLSTWKIKQEMEKNRALHFCERGWLKRPLEGPKPPWLVEMFLSIFVETTENSSAHVTEAIAQDYRSKDAFINARDISYILTL